MLLYTYIVVTYPATVTPHDGPSPAFGVPESWLGALPVVATDVVRYDGTDAAISWVLAVVGSSASGLAGEEMRANGGADELLAHQAGEEQR